MNISEHELAKWKMVAGIFSAIAIPVVIAVIGWIAQESISTQSVRKDYVEMATRILLNPPNADDDQELRKWAALVIDENSPVPLTRGLREKLADKGLPSSTAREKVHTPLKLLTPCPNLEAVQANAPTSETTQQTEKAYKYCSDMHMNLISFLKDEAKQRESVKFIIGKPVRDEDSGIWIVKPLK